MVGLDGKPVQKSLRQVLVEWLGFRQATVERRSRHRLLKAEDRIHILEGRQAVLLNIDEVIRIIRASDEPKPALIEAFRLSERQADDILEIRLRQLARLEAIKIEQELTELRSEAERLRDILANPATLKRLVIKEIEADARQFGDERRTLIQAEKRVLAEIRVVDEPVTVVVSQKGWLRALKGHEVDVGGLSFKAGDALYGVFPCRSVDTLIALGSSGRSYSVAVSQLPGGRGDGAPVTSFIELESGTQLLHYLAGPASQSLVLAGSLGFGLVATIGDLSAAKRVGKSFLALEAGELPLRPARVDPALPQLAVLSEQGRLLTFPVTELKLQPKGGRGLTLIDLEAKDRLLAVSCFATQLMLSGVARGNKPKDDVLRLSGLAAHAGKRARKGKDVEGFKQVLEMKGL
jgi:topoisomerase-4 subunit A